MVAGRNSWPELAVKDRLNFFLFEKRDPPPLLEWWDSHFLPNKTYADIDAGLAKIGDEDSLVTWFIQHPIQIKPPGDNGPPPPKPLMLTKRVNYI